MRTQGAAGCTVKAAGHKPIQVPAWPVDAIDTTGAGDALAGAFLAALVRGASAEEATRNANAVAALSTTRMGAAESVPHQAEVERRLHTQPATAMGYPVE